MRTYWLHYADTECSAAASDAGYAREGGWLAQDARPKLKISNRTGGVDDGR